MENKFYLLNMSVQGSKNKSACLTAFNLQAWVELYSLMKWILI